MVAILPSTGGQIDVPDNLITLVAGPYPLDLGPHTYIHGFGPGVIVTLEPVQHFLQRLKVEKPFVEFTRLDGSPVYIKAKAVTLVTLPLDGQYPSAAKTVIFIGQLKQAVVEDRPTVIGKLQAGGATTAFD